MVQIIILSSLFNRASKQTILPRDFYSRFRFSLSLVTFFILIEVHNDDVLHKKEAKELWITLANMCGVHVRRSIPFQHCGLSADKGFCVYKRVF